MSAFHFFLLTADYSDTLSRQYANKNKHSPAGYHSILLPRAMLHQRINWNVNNTNANPGLSPSFLNFLSNLMGKIATERHMLRGTGHSKTQLTSVELRKNSGKQPKENMNRAAEMVQRIPRDSAWTSSRRCSDWSIISLSFALHRARTTHSFPLI